MIWVFFGIGYFSFRFRFHIFGIGIGYFSSYGVVQMLGISVGFKYNRAIFFILGTYGLYIRSTCLNTIEYLWIFCQHLLPKEYLNSLSVAFHHHLSWVRFRLIYFCWPDFLHIAMRNTKQSRYVLYLIGLTIMVTRINSLSFISKW